MSPEPVRIALVGNPGSGKTSITKELCRLTGAQHLSFATALKTELARMLAGYAGTDRYNEHIRAVYDVATKDAYRPLLQALGVFRRDVDPAHWVRKVEAQIAGNGAYVIDDCRFDNEFAMLQSRRFRLVRLHNDVTARPLSGAEAQHESERDWPMWVPDLELDYREGVSHQAYRTILALGLPVTEAGAAEIAEHLGDVALGGAA